MGVLGLDLRCLSANRPHSNICRECATRHEIVTAQQKNWTDTSMKTFVTSSFCDKDYGNPASAKYCGPNGMPEWDEQPCAGAVCSQCPLSASCYTRRASTPETRSLPWRMQAPTLGYQRDCMFGQHAHCTKAEPCSPCAVEDVLKYEPNGNALPPKSDLLNSFFMINVTQTLQKGR